MIRDGEISCKLNSYIKINVLYKDVDHDFLQNVTIAKYMKFLRPYTTMLVSFDNMMV